MHAFAGGAAACRGPAGGPSSSALVARCRSVPPGAVSCCPLRTASPQWLVPSSRLILFQTLYLPIGFFIGRRLTSCSVRAS